MQTITSPKTITRAQLAVESLKARWDGLILNDTLANRQSVEDAISKADHVVCGLGQDQATRKANFFSRVALIERSYDSFVLVADGASDDD